MAKEIVVTLLLFFVSLTTHSQDNSSIDEGWKDDVWTISGGDDTVHASVNGKITDGDRLRIFMRPSDSCRNAALITTFFTHSKNPDIKRLRNIPIKIAFLGGDIDATIDYVLPLFGRHIAWVSLLNTKLSDMKLVFGVMNEEQNEIEMTIKPTKSFRTDNYFDIPTNAWSLEGSMEALDRAENLCLRIAEEISL
ncbi:MAG: hypothetical protein VX690_04500 [Pseudomonadota bacterium]|nr:hypothetical protein [Pseudomonadota bacterium]